MVNGAQQTDSSYTTTEVQNPGGTKLATDNGLDQASLADIKGINQVKPATDVPNVDIGDYLSTEKAYSPWHQDVFEKQGGFWSFMGGYREGSLGKVMEERAVNGLSKEEHDAYEKESKAEKRWEESGYRGKPPDMPEHEKVAALVKQQEQAVENKVLASMSPADRQKYLTAKKQYNAAIAKAYLHGDAPPPMPPEVQAFNTACRKAVGGVETLTELGQEHKGGGIWITSMDS